MLDRAIKALETCVNHQKTGFCEIGCSHNGCLMIENGSCIIDIMPEIIALLKAQEPRVVTLDEVKMLDSDYYYLESMRSPGKELREILGAYGLTCVTWPSITWARQTMGDSGYGKTWRCWTSRPTDEQREAVKWDA